MSTKGRIISNYNLARAKNKARIAKSPISKLGKIIKSKSAPKIRRLIPNR